MAESSVLELESRMKNMKGIYMFYTPREVGDILKVNYRKILDLIILGQLNAIRVGRQYRIPESELEEYLEKQKYKVHS